MNEELQVQIALINDIFRAIEDEIIIRKIQKDAEKIWPRGIDDPAYI